MGDDNNGATTEVANAVMQPKTTILSKVTVAQM
jgi:hypothetical protein